MYEVFGTKEGLYVVPIDASGNAIGAAYPLSIAGGYTLKPVTFAAGATESSEVDIEGYDSIGLETDADFTSSALTFKAASASGGTFKAVKSGGTAVTTATVSASEMASLESEFLALRPYRYLKLISVSAQTNATTVTLHLKG
jgi:hypothetical protein